MLVILSAIAAAAGALGLLFAWLARRARAVPSGSSGASGLRALAPVGGGSALAFTALAAAVLFLLTVPSAEPFSEGMNLGLGFIIGAALGLWVLVDGAGAVPEGLAPDRAVRPLSAAALGSAGVLLLFRGYPNDALTGCALGAAFSAACLGALLRPAPVRADGAADTIPALHGLDTYALAMAAATAGAWLGVARFQRPEPGALAGGYWAVAPLLLAAGAIALILTASGGSASRATRGRALATGFGAAAVAVLIAGVLQWRLLTDLSWTVLVFGPIAAAFLVFSFFREEPDPDAPDTALMPRPTLLAAGAALLAVLVPAIAFREMQGYGQALTATAAVLVVATAYVSPLVLPRAGWRFAEAFGTAAVTIMLLLAWLRVFLERTEGLRTLDFQQPYNLLSAVIGAGAVFGVLAYHERAARRSDEAVAWSTAALFLPVALLGLAVAAAPLLVAALWGERAVAALVAGLVIAEAGWMLLLAWARSERLEVLGAAPHVVLLSAVLIAAQLGPWVTAMELTRENKVWIVVALAILVVAGLAIDAVRDRAGQNRAAAREVGHEPLA